jgi:hypothetical protein
LIHPLHHCECEPIAISQLPHCITIGKYPGVVVVPCVLCIARCVSPGRGDREERGSNHWAIGAPQRNSVRPRPSAPPSCAIAADVPFQVRETVGWSGAWSDAVICPAFYAAERQAAGPSRSSRAKPRSPKHIRSNCGKPRLSQPRLTDYYAIPSLAHLSPSRS